MGVSIYFRSAQRSLMSVGFSGGEIDAVGGFGGKANVAAKKKEEDLQEESLCGEKSGEYLAYFHGGL